jgi:hypothetical protein
VRYRDMTPVPPLRPEQTEWVAGLLKEKLHHTPERIATR